MIDFANMWALARAEMRLTRRLVRYWIFTVLACLLMILGYAYYAFLHSSFSYYAASVSWINPRFFAGAMGFYFAYVMLLGITFLAFEIRARDQRERVSEVLDARPFGNIELLAGRALGILIPVWLPAAFMAALIALIGWLIDSPVALISFFQMLVVLTLPMFVFALPFTFAVTLLLRARIAAALVMIATYVALFVLAFFVLPATWSALADLSGSAGQPFQSELAPFVATKEMWVHQLGLVLGGLGFLLIAAAVHPRRDDGSKPLRLGVGGLLVALMIACFLQVVFWREGGLEQRKAWREAHLARVEAGEPDILEMSALARVEPGESLRVEADLSIGAPGDASLDTLVFTLNPGLEVSAVSAGGTPLAFTHDMGLLEVTPFSALVPGQTLDLSVVAEGGIDESFGYTDSEKELFEGTFQEYNTIFFLGTQNAISHPDHVALLPGAAWLPRSGTDIGRDDPRERAPDRFRLSLEIEVPEGFLVAGPGRREAVETSTAGAVRYRFAPEALVPDPGIVAGRFTARSLEAAGTVFEILVHPGHDANLELFGRASDELKAQLEERLDAARAWGLEYPYGAFTLVEVPGRLRGYEAGWRRDSAFAPPAMLLMRESTFPTARFKQRFDDEERWEGAEGGTEGEMVRHLARFFENDFGGGNVFTAFARNMIRYPAPMQGESSIALDFILDDLASRLVTEHNGYFSSFLFGSSFNQMVGQAIQGLFASGFRQSLAEVVMEQATDRPDVWDSVLGASLADLDPAADARRAHDVLTLKGRAFAEYLVETHGEDTLGAMLGALRTRALEGAVTRDDLVAAGLEAGIDLAPVLVTWLDATDLPAFETGPVSFERLEDDEGGVPRYQLVAPVRNSGQAAGLARIKWVRFDEGQREEGGGDVAAIAAGETLELGLVVDREPTRAWIETFFSLNRGALALSLPPVDENADLSPAEPFSGSRVSDWVPRDDGAIVVDDLDEGFEAETAPPSGLLAFFRQGDGQRNEDAELDQGLPVQEFQPPSGGWMRYRNFSAHGQYRRTAALAPGGKGDSLVRFRADVPKDGRYRLELHMPSMRSFGIVIQNQPLGTWTLVVEDSSGREEVPFEASSSTEGWNEVNEFELASGEVILTLGNKLEDGGRLVVADAIRWIPIERRKGENE